MREGRHGGDVFELVDVRVKEESISKWKNERQGSSNLHQFLVNDPW